MSDNKDASTGGQDLLKHNTSKQSDNKFYDGRSMVQLAMKNVEPTLARGGDLGADRREPSPQRFGAVLTK